MLALALIAMSLPTAKVDIQCDTQVVTIGQRLPNFRKSIKNLGRHEMLVVQPNDGCEWHMRTPHIGWAIKKVGDKSPWPSQVPKLANVMRCGNVDPLSDQQLTSLKPLGTVEILGGDSFLGKLLSKPGRYRLVFYYAHVTDVKQFRLAAFGHRTIVDRVRASEPYQLLSNEVVITVKPKSSRS